MHRAVPHRSSAAAKVPGTSRAAMERGHIHLKILLAVAIVSTENLPEPYSTEHQNDGFPRLVRLFCCQSVRPQNRAR